MERADLPFQEMNKDERHWGKDGSDWDGCDPVRTQAWAYNAAADLAFHT